MSKVYNLLKGHYDKTNELNPNQLGYLVGMLEAALRASTNPDLDTPDEQSTFHDEGVGERIQEGIKTTIRNIIH